MWEVRNFFLLSDLHETWNQSSGCTKIKEYLLKTPNIYYRESRDQFLWCQILNFVIYLLNLNWIWTYNPMNAEGAKPRCLKSKLKMLQFIVLYKLNKLPIIFNFCNGESPHVNFNVNFSLWPCLVGCCYCHGSIFITVARGK